MLTIEDLKQTNFYHKNKNFRNLIKNLEFIEFCISKCNTKRDIINNIINNSSVRNKTKLKVKFTSKKDKLISYVTKNNIGTWTTFDVKTYAMNTSYGTITVELDPITRLVSFIPLKTTMFTVGTNIYVTGQSLNDYTYVTIADSNNSQNIISTANIFDNNGSSFYFKLPSVPNGSYQLYLMNYSKINGTDNLFFEVNDQVSISNSSSILTSFNPRELKTYSSYSYVDVLAESTSEFNYISIAPFDEVSNILYTIELMSNYGNGFKFRLPIDIPIGSYQLYFKDYPNLNGPNLYFAINSTIELKLISFNPADDTSFKPGDYVNVLCEGSSDMTYISIAALDNVLNVVATASIFDNSGEEFTFEVPELPNGNYQLYFEIYPNSNGSENLLFTVQGEVILTSFEPEEKTTYKNLEQVIVNGENLEFLTYIVCELYDGTKINAPIYDILSTSFKFDIGSDWIQGSYKIYSDENSSSYLNMAIVGDLTLISFDPVNDTSFDNGETASVISVGTENLTYITIIVGETVVTTVDIFEVTNTSFKFIIPSLSNGVYQFYVEDYTQSKLQFTISQTEGMSLISFNPPNDTLFKKGEKGITVLGTKLENMPYISIALSTDPKNVKATAPIYNNTGSKFNFDMPSNISNGDYQLYVMSYSEVNGTPNLFFKIS